MKHTKRKLVRVEWWDIVADSEWLKDDKVESAHPCITVGFVIKETKHEIVIASTISGKESNARITIPIGCIKSRKLVRL